MKNKWLETSGGWVKYEANPVMGGKYGTCFDISVLKEGGMEQIGVAFHEGEDLGFLGSESEDGV